MVDREDLSGAVYFLALLLFLPFIIAFLILFDKDAKRHGGGGLFDE